jgi:hypothetical protein
MFGGNSKETYAHLMPAAQNRTVKALDANFKRYVIGCDFEAQTPVI